VCRIVGRSIKRALECLTWLYRSERAQTLACFESCFLVVLGSYTCDILELVFILMTSSNSSKTDYEFITCCVFELGDFLGFTY
jgi:hypothetical protein